MIESSKSHLNISRSNLLGTRNTTHAFVHADKTCKRGVCAPATGHAGSRDARVVCRAEPGRSLPRPRLGPAQQLSCRAPCLSLNLPSDRTTHPPQGHPHQPSHHTRFPLSSPVPPSGSLKYTPSHSRSPHARAGSWVAKHEPSVGSPAAADGAPLRIPLPAQAGEQAGQEQDHGCAACAHFWEVSRARPPWNLGARSLNSRAVALSSPLALLTRG